MKEYRLLNIITALLLALLVLSSCTQNLPVAVQPEPPEAPEGTLHIAYCASDSLNPFFCEGEDNALLWPLAFLPLYELDENFTPQPVLADSMVQMGNYAELTLQSNIMTAAGASMSIADVLYSFRLAKESPAYKAQLSSVTDIAIGATADVIRLTLKEPNIHVCSLLTFPIVQYGTADSADDLPVGAGPYTYSETDEGISMYYNPNYYNGTVRTAQITLVDASADASKAFSLKSERIDCTFNNLADGEVFRLSAGAYPIPMTNLVFLGVNSENAYLQEASIRQALSYMLDRQAIAEHAFCGYAQPTSLPVHPAWSALQTETVSDSVTADLQAAITLLNPNESSELSGNTPTAIFTDNTTRFSLRLVCCAGNAFKTDTAAQIKEQLSEAGITVQIAELEEEAYFEAVQNGEYDLYLGEVKLTADMDLSVFLNYGNALGWGIDNDSITCTALWQDYREGAITLGAFLSVFAGEMPFIPLCFRQGIFYTSRTLVNEIVSRPENLFANIYVWEKEEN